MILMACEESVIRNMKFILYCFECMSGLKINYHKSEVIVVGVDREFQDLIANGLNCKVGQLPMTYLGLPISDRFLGNKAFSYLGTKLRKNLQP